MQSKSNTSGNEEDVRYFLHNHLRFTILYHKDAETDLARIVGFEVEPFSVKHEYEKPYDKNTPVLNTCNPGRAIKVTHEQAPQPVQDGVEAIFTYDVVFSVSEQCTVYTGPRQADAWSLADTALTHRPIWSPVLLHTAMVWLGAGGAGAGS